jgi:FtsH-binding integral membrane protein
MLQDDIERAPLVSGTNTTTTNKKKPNNNYENNATANNNSTNNNPLEGVESLEKSLRRGFVQKVFGILGFQLIITAAIISAFVVSPEVKLYVQSPSGVWVYWTTLVTSIVIILVMVCFSNLMRKVPINYIMLFSFTVVEAVLIGVICTYYNGEDVLIAFGICVLLVFCLSLFACQTRIDITGWGPFLFVFLVCLIFFGIFAAIFQTKVLTIVYCSLGVLLFSFYLVSGSFR